ncbi:hypothetical protein F4861DRAFT_502045 [Xylaria intraflava]|nr:hypothetical protein F4861DRAFT_502045 [Xylaria intraflava]
MSIQPLPDDVIAQIKSSTSITSLNGVVCGLIRNSLDAGATKVSVSVDYIRGSCSVEDNGLGIPPTEFHPSGGLGKLHFTSKYPVRDDVHGKYGAFLASLASLSLFSITSHHHRYHSHNSIQIHNSDVLARHTPSPLDQRLSHLSHGTRATVRDLFGSMPVRVKQRAIDMEKGLHSRHWELLKRDIVALMLAWNGPVSVSGQELSNRWAFSLRCGEMRRDDEAEDRHLAARVCTILYQAQLSDAHSLETWVPLRASAGRVSVVGAVSLHPVATKRIQFISMGICPVPNEYGSNILYEEINRAFSNSSYGVEERTRNFGGADERDKHEDDDHHGGDSFTNQELKGRKGTDRWPMFYIKIQVDKSTNFAEFQEMDDFFDERHGNLVAIVDILKAMVYEFLKTYHFRPKRIKNTRESNKDAPAKPPQKGLSTKQESRPTRETVFHEKRFVGDLVTTQLGIHGDSGSRLRLESPFDFWTRIKSGSAQQSACNGKADKRLQGESIGTSGYSVARTPDLNSATPVSVPPLFSPDGSLLRPPFSDPSSMVTRIGRNDQFTEIGKPRLKEGICWTNPATKETTIVDPITGFVLGSHPDYRHGEGEKSDKIHSKRLRLHDGPILGGERSVWFGELLSSWDNPIFKATEPCIPSAFREENTLGRPAQPFGCSTWFQGSSEVGPSIQCRVSKSALRNAKIIAQLDRKFIFAKVVVNSYAYGPIPPNLSESFLIMIDQHAADERCQVESLMGKYFEHTTSGTSTACTELLERPLKFEISVSDATQFESMAMHFSHWGIHYSVVSMPQARDTGRRRIDVTRLPPSIAERCRLEPRLLIELLRKEAWAVDEHSRGDARAKPVSPGNGDATAPPWITRFHGCPEGILDMINSRACRSSIMFNDPLTWEECTHLLRRLADCAFPFQCAHGRPSMVPLVHVGDDTAGTFNERKPDKSFMGAFNAWNAKGGKRRKGDED